MNSGDNQEFGLVACKKVRFANDQIESYLSKYDAYMQGLCFPDKF